ncbi:MAG: hypothetical protein OXG44_12680 [Gammaproteobacteria bacterium]|nr:hypothetical protein [Gammaproteobacteria bacterium]
MSITYLRHDNQQAIGPIWIAWGRTRSKQWILQTSTLTFKIHRLVYRNRLQGKSYWQVTYTVSSITHPHQLETIIATANTPPRAQTNPRNKHHAFLS